MSTEADIVDKLKEAMEISCNDALYFSDDEAQLIDAECLLTINAAKTLASLNHYFGDPYKIRLEHDTNKFVTACTPLFGKTPANNFLGYEQVIRKSNDSERPGRIDIALYARSNGEDAPLCAIEVKGFNPSKKLIVKDLERNAEYFKLSSPTGISKLPFTVFIAMHSYNGVWSDEKENKNIQKVRNRYNSYIRENSKLNFLSHSIDIITVRRGMLPKLDDPHIQEHGLQGDEDYHFVGVIVTFSRKI